MKCYDDANLCLWLHDAFCCSKPLPNLILNIRRDDYLQFDVSEVLTCKGTTYTVHVARPMGVCLFRVGCEEK